MSVYDKPLPSTEGIYHKFEDAKTYIMRLVSEPIVVVSSFKGTESTKYAWLAYNLEAQAPQIVRLPVTAARQVWDIVAKQGDPTEYSLKITRTGSSFDTKYVVEASPKKIPLSEIAPKAEEELAKIDPIEMINKGNGIVDVYFLAEAEDGSSKSRSESQPAPVNTEDEAGDDEPW